MVTKKKKSSTGEKEEKKGKDKVGKLKLNKETVKDLGDKEARGVKGERLAMSGLRCTQTCPEYCNPR